MSQNKSIALFEAEPVRRIWSEKDEKWYFSVVDVVRVLTSQQDFLTARKYWNKLSQRLKEEGSESVTKCHQLKMQSSDGKYYLTDAADPEVLFRIIQSIPSPKAEPFKLWLAKVGYERLQETADPELSVQRGRENWKRLGRSQKWIQQRMMGQETRNKLTDYWSEHEITKAEEFAILTNIIHEEWSDVTVGEHKKLKGLENQNFRDHMTEAELLFTALAELSTREIAESEKATGMLPNALAGKKGGGVAKRARKDYELETGKKVVSGESFLSGGTEQKKLKKTANRTN
ncbi:MAG: Bro-N domain-containing protein [Patescibacteria group bacterium]